MVQVKLFAGARELAGAAVATVNLPSGATVAQLRAALADRYPALGDLAGRAAFAIDAEYAAESDVIRAGADVACIPPVSGG